MILYATAKLYSDALNVRTRSISIRLRQDMLTLDSVEGNIKFFAVDVDIVVAFSS